MSLIILCVVCMYVLCYLIHYAGKLQLMESGRVYLVALDGSRYEVSVHAAAAVMCVYV